MIQLYGSLMIPQHDDAGIRQFDDWTIGGSRIDIQTIQRFNNLTIRGSCGATRCHQIKPGATRCHQKTPDATRCHQKQPDATRSYQKPPEASRSHQKPPEAIRSHQKLPEATRCHQKPLEAIRSHKGDAEPHLNPATDDAQVTLSRI